MVKFKSISVSLIVLAAAVSVVLASATVQDRKARSLPRDKRQTATQRAQQTAVGNQGLQAAAAITGSYVRNEIVRHPGAPGTLEELHGLSEVVLTGRVASNTTRPTDDGKSIETIYLVDVLDVMKGSPGATAIRMATVGGQTVFPDGSVATVQTPHYMKPVNGETLLLFLRHQRAQRQELSDANIFVPTCDQLGIYNLAPAWSKWIMTSGDFDTPLAHWIANQRFTMQSFLDRVRMIGGTR